MRILVYSSGRQDWGILEGVVRSLRSVPDIKVVLIAGGAHLREGIVPVELGGIPVDEIVDTLQASNTALGVSQTAGWTTALMSSCIQRWGPDAIMVLGDRTETLAVAVAAVCMKVPLIHLHGGEETEGAVDNLCRHAITKLASLHFVANEAFAKRLLRMGESPGRVFVSGAPGLDRLLSAPRMDPAELAKHLQMDELSRPLILMTYHPTTLGDLSPLEEVQIVLGAVQKTLEAHPNSQLIITASNVDAGGDAINAEMKKFVDHHADSAKYVPSLGEFYPAVLSQADVMIGNSSSGIIESGVFRLPVVDIGDRQAGRPRGQHVLQVDLSVEAIGHAIDKCLSSNFRTSLPDFDPLYGDGRAAFRITQTLQDLAPNVGPNLLRKGFYEYPSEVFT